jgi:CHAD domain-containing protein
MKFSVWFSGSCALVYSMQSVAIKHDPSYEFRPDMSVSANVCRVWQETVSEAVSLLGTGSDTGIHETRKRIKKLRALLCFLHPATPGIDDRTEVNDELRRIARTVGAVRDAASMVECAERDLAEWSRLSEVLKSRLAQLKAEEHVPLDNLVARLALLQLRVLVREFSVAKGINLAFERGRECLRF